MKRYSKVELFDSLTFLTVEIVTRQLHTRRILKQWEFSQHFANKRSLEVMWTNASINSSLPCLDKRSKTQTNLRDKTSRRCMMSAIRICATSMRCIRTFVFTVRCWANAWNFFVTLLLTMIFQRSSLTDKMNFSTTNHHNKINAKMTSSWISRLTSIKAVWRLLLTIISSRLRQRSFASSLSTSNVMRKMSRRWRRNAWRDYLRFKKLHTKLSRTES